MHQKDLITGGLAAWNPKTQKFLNKHARLNQAALVPAAEQFLISEYKDKTEDKSPEEIERIVAYDKFHLRLYAQRGLGGSPSPSPED